MRKATTPYADARQSVDSSHVGDLRKSAPPQAFKSATRQPKQPKPSVKDVEEIRDILNFAGEADVDTVLAKLNEKLRVDGLNMAKEIVFDNRNFCKIMHYLYPHIEVTERFSHEGSMLVSDALQCLFNAFAPVQGFLSYTNLIGGLKILHVNEVQQMRKSSMLAQGIHNASSPVRAGKATITKTDND